MPEDSEAEPLAVSAATAGRRWARWQSSTRWATSPRTPAPSSPERHEPRRHWPAERRAVALRPGRPLHAADAARADDAAQPHLGGPRLWVKREDCTGPGFGGNKLRKLDYVLHEAMRARRRHAGLGRRRAIQQPAPGRGRGGQARARLPSRRLSWPAGATFGGVRQHRQCAAQPPVRRHPARRAVERRSQRRHPRPRGQAAGRRAARPTSCPTASPIRWARWPMPRRSPRSPQQCAALGFVRRPSSTARAAPARRPGWSSAPASACPARASSASTSMPSPNGCAPTCWPTAVPPPSCSTSRSTTADVEVVAGHAGPAYGVPHAATVEAIRLGARAGSAGARPGLFGQGSRRPDRPDPRRTMDGAMTTSSSSTPAARPPCSPIAICSTRSDRCSTPKPACCST